MIRSKVAVLKTNPRDVVEDYGRLLELAEYRKYLPQDKETILKINISWSTFYPACSSTPWQLDGTFNKLIMDGYDPKTLHPTHNQTVVVDGKLGEVNNKHKAVQDKYGLRSVYLWEDVKWIPWTGKTKLKALPQVYPDGFEIPEFFIGKNIIHFPTMKTHVFTTTTGAMKNAFGGLLNNRRHWTHRVIHETLVDLLKIQKEIHTGLFAVMDGTVAGDGPGPRAMRPVIKNFIAASGDQVAIDAVAAKMMGFDPMKLGYIRLAHEEGLGVGDPREIEVIGADISKENWGFIQEDTFASKGQKMIYHGPLHRFEKALLQSPLVPWSYLASRLYHDIYWYPFVGKPRVDAFMKTEWGELFRSY